MPRTTIEALLAAARERLERLDPFAAGEATHSGATLIDIRVESQIAQDGAIPGALVISRPIAFILGWPNLVGL